MFCVRNCSGKDSHRRTEIKLKSIRMLLYRQNCQLLIIIFFGLLYSIHEKHLRDYQEPFRKKINEPCSIVQHRGTSGTELTLVWTFKAADNYITVTQILSNHYITNCVL